METYLKYTFQALVLLFTAYAVLFTLLRMLQRLGMDRSAPVTWLIKLLTLLFVIADWWVNLIISPLLLDLPIHQRELVTGRLQRYKLRYGERPRDDLNLLERWRLGVARFICQRLNQYDPDHC